jgi:hypothetical protein
MYARLIDFENVDKIDLAQDCVNDSIFVTVVIFIIRHSIRSYVTSY